MRKVRLYFSVLFCSLILQSIVGQEGHKGKSKIEILQKLKEKITAQEKGALKKEVQDINKRQEEGHIAESEAKELKGKAAKKRALNIENRLAIIDNRIALLKRNNGNVMKLDVLDSLTDIHLDWGNEGKNGDRLFGLSISGDRSRVQKRNDRRTYSDFVFAVGLNNAMVEGRSLEDTPYKIGGSRFFEMGWQWRTRVFRNTNFMRFNYGLSFQFNGLKPKGSQYFVVAENGQTELREFEFDLRKSKLRMDNLVFPMHIEFGPSKAHRSEDRIRYSLQDKFRVGLGGYAGFNLGVRQKLIYDRNGDKVKDKLKRQYNASAFVYGLSAYLGYDGLLLYLKYDLNPIFKEAAVKQRNISLGLRFDL